jgi:hypothetical protein
VLDICSTCKLNHKHLPRLRQLCCRVWNKVSTGEKSFIRCWYVEKGQIQVAEHNANPFTNNLSVSMFGISLSLSSETAAEFPKGKYRLGHAVVLVAYSLSSRRPVPRWVEKGGPAVGIRRAKYTFKRPYKQEWHYWGASIRTRHVMWEITWRGGTDGLTYNCTTYIRICLGTEIEGVCVQPAERVLGSRVEVKSQVLPPKHHGIKTYGEVEIKLRVF